MNSSRDALAKIVTLLLAAAILSGCPAGSKKERILKRADAYFAAGKYDNAKIEYLNVLRMDNRNVTAFQRLGFIWLEQGVPFRATPFLLKVRELAPQNIAARARLARSLASVGQQSEARKEASVILQSDPANAEALLVLADASHTKEEVAAAEQQLQKIARPDTAAFHLASATLALRKGDLAAVADEARKALSIDPQLPQAYVAIGYAYLLSKDIPRAAAEFKNAAEIAPLRSSERIGYAEFQVANGARDEAKVLLRKITEKAPDYLPAWRVLAQIALADKKYDESLSLLGNILSRDPDNPDIRMFQSEILLAKRETAKAIGILDQLDSKFPDNPKVKYQLARAHLQNKNPAQATAAFEQAIAANPNYTESILALAELNLSSGKPQPVVTAMQDLIKKRPDLWQARLLLANAYQALNRWDDAVAVCREQIKIAPRSADAYFLLGSILDRQKKTDEARQAFQKSAELTPDNLTAVNQLVTMDLAEKRYDAAMERAQQELRQNPRAVVGHFMVARIYAAQQNWPLAEAALRKAIELDSNFSPAYNLLISIYLETDKLPEALSQLQAGLAKDPNNREALMVMAGVYDEMEDYDKAREAYEKVLALDPKSATALNNLADNYLKQPNQLDKAYELARKARALEPNDPAIADTLGWVLYKRGDYQQALPLLQEGASKLADDPEVQFHLGMINYVTGQAEAARSAFQRALDAEDDFSDRPEAERRLALLQNSGGQSNQLTAGDLEELLTQQPNDPVVLSRVGEAYEKQGQTAKAAAAYEQWFKLNPKLAAPALKLAHLYAGPLRKPDKALEFAKKARELAPNDAQAAGVLGQIALEAKNFTWAYSLLVESVRQRQNDTTILHNLALATYALGKVPEARQTMQRCLDAAPSDAGQAEEAKRFLKLTALDEPSAARTAAEPEIQKVLQSEPDYVPALMAQAAIQLQRNEAKTAAGLYSQILRKYPDFAPAQKRLSAIYAANPDDIGKAYDLAMKARKTLSDDPELARTLAKLNFERKEFTFAVQLFQESAARQSLPAKDLYYLGVAQLETRQDAKGRETLERALAAGLQDPLAQDARQRLAPTPAK